MTHSAKHMTTPLRGSHVIKKKKTGRRRQALPTAASIGTVTHPTYETGDDATGHRSEDLLKGIVYLF